MPLGKILNKGHPIEDFAYSHHGETGVMANGRKFVTHVLLHNGDERQSVTIQLIQMDEGSPYYRNKILDNPAKLHIPLQVLDSLQTALGGIKEKFKGQGVFFKFSNPTIHRSGLDFDRVKKALIAAGYKHLERDGVFTKPGEKKIFIRPGGLLKDPEFIDLVLKLELSKSKK